MALFGRWGDAARAAHIAILIVALAMPTNFFATSASAQAIDSSLLQQFEELSQRRSGGSFSMPSPLDEARDRRDSDGTEMTEELVDSYILRERLPSALEDDYERRLGEPVKQFGYDMFNRRPLGGGLITGRVPDNYVLGVGDELVVTFHGSTSRSIVTAVDREGRLILEGLPPIVAAGRPFGDVQEEVRSRTREALIGTEAFVSLGTLRMMSVYVLGEVERPGVQRATSLTTVLEALALAGGLKKTGSFRNIQLISGGETRVIDLYRFLDGRAAPDMSLTDGARVVVPVIGKTAAVSGGVRRPGIYELPSSGTITQAELLALAGGGLRPSGYSYVLNRIEADGDQKISTLSALGQPVRDGDILVAGLRQDFQVGGVELVGHVRTPGTRSLGEAPTLKDLIGNGQGFKDYPYLLFGVIERTDPRSLSRVLKPFSPEKVIYGQQNIELQNRDRVILFGRQDIQFLSSNETRRVVLTGEYTPPPGALSRTEADAQARMQAQLTSQGRLLSNGQKPLKCGPLEELARIVNDTKSDRYATAIRAVFVQLDVTNADVDRQMDVGEQGLAELRAAGQASVAPAETSRQSTQQMQQMQPMTEQQMILAERLREREEKKRQEADDPDCPNVYRNTKGLLPFILEYVVSADGALRWPGVYPVAEDTSLASLVAATGGTTYNVDLTNVELGIYKPEAANGSAFARETLNALETDIAAISINPASGIRFNSRYSSQEAGAVLLAGEVRHPGVYTIRRGEKLSEIIERAGGLTDQAYPYGAVFTRTRVKEAQELGFQRTARELNLGLATAALKQRELTAQTLVAAQQLAEKLATTEVPGRVVIEADPRMLAERPELDTVLEPGDRLHIPKRPNYVLMIGDVLNPGALQFMAGKEVKDYLREAGGALPTADDDRTFVVYPNGVARPVRLSSWGFSSGTMLPPGSSIVVPKDVEPIDTLDLIRDLTAIFGQLAVSAASIAVISRD